jgi:hypothetical protein
VVAALRDWFDAFGETPLSYEWSPSTAELLGLSTARSDEWSLEYPRWPSAATVCKHFGRWAHAVRAANLPPARAIAPRRGLVERVESARRLNASGYGATEIAAVLDLSPRTVRDYLRSGRCRDCGTAVITAERCPRCAARLANPPHWNPEEVLQAMRSWMAEEERAPTSSDWTPTADRERKWAREYPRWPSYVTVRTLFGSWRNGIAAARLPMRRRQWRGDDILAALRGYARVNGRPPTQSDLERCEELPSPATVRARLGSLPAALARAGLGVRRRPWNRDLIVSAVLRHVEEHGRLPSSRDWSRSTSAHPHATTVLRHFGSWSAAVAGASARMDD